MQSCSSLHLDGQMRLCLLRDDEADLVCLCAMVRPRKDLANHIERALQTKPRKS